jgi:hypothetical protein
MSVITKFKNFIKKPFDKYLDKEYGRYSTEVDRKNREQRDVKIENDKTVEKISYLFCEFEDLGFEVNISPTFRNFPSEKGPGGYVSVRMVNKKDIQNMDLKFISKEIKNLMSEFILRIKDENLKVSEIKYNFIWEDSKEKEHHQEERFQINKEFDPKDISFEFDKLKYLYYDKNVRSSKLLELTIRIKIGDFLLKNLSTNEGIVGEKPIENKNLYINQMNSTISDKIFFADRINFDVIVDFGCADGSTLLKIKQLNPKIKLIGYDIDDDMISKAKANLPNALITNDWNRVVSEIQKYKSPLLNLSSVIHEVYSYSNSNSIKSFWNNVFGGDFKYISIRDMIPSCEINRDEISTFKDDTSKVRRMTNQKLLSSFENKWGHISDNYRTFIHYLLKYKYTDNWNREVLENYLPITLETLISKIKDGYKIVYQENFILPFFKKQIKNDFNIDILHTTHTKMIIKNLRFRK